jgi:hypothetical protein
VGGEGGGREKFSENSSSLPENSCVAASCGRECRRSSHASLSLPQEEDQQRGERKDSIKKFGFKFLLVTDEITSSVLLLPLSSSPSPPPPSSYPLPCQAQTQATSIVQQLSAPPPPPPHLPLSRRLHHTTAPHTTPHPFRALGECHLDSLRTR